MARAEGPLVTPALSTIATPLAYRIGRFASDLKSATGSPMRNFQFVTVDVFTTRRFGGNPLAVFPDARGMTDAEMQALAAELNLSETTFVLPADDTAHTARVRIFNRTAEMPFAGHPNVGTAFVLAASRENQETLRFEEKAGIVQVRLSRGPGGLVIGAEIEAPQPLQLLGELPVPGIAACLGLQPCDVLTGTHAPLRASVGVEFVLVEVLAEALSAAAPDIASFRRAAAPDPGRRLSIFMYARTPEGVRARMFAPLAGTWEDPATGSANATLAALLLSLSPEPSLAYDARQGEEMGRPSLLRVAARRAPDGIRASVGGRCVEVFRGEVLL
jgi:trans-2,3-dihydro-3-hydroxyanthranilate isomerase